MNVSVTISSDLEQLISDAYRLSADVGKEIADLLTEGRQRPLTPEEAARMLRAVIVVLRRSAEKRGDSSSAGVLRENLQTLIERVTSLRRSVDSVGAEDLAPERTYNKKYVQLVPRKGIPVGPVFPRPYFHGRDIAMNAGFVKTTDLALWDGNERFEIQLAQIEQKTDRRPDPE